MRKSMDMLTMVQRANAILASELDMRIGQVFDTPFEEGCVVLTKPDELGNFSCIDSDGVEVECNVSMVIKS
jgi:hypothetical protein